MKNTSTTVWNPEHGLAIKEFGNNPFTFQFFDTGDMQFLLDRGPWSFDDSAHLLNPVGGDIRLSHTLFTHAPVWLFAHDIPDAETKENAKLHPQFGVWLHAPKAKRRLRPSKAEYEREKTPFIASTPKVGGNDEKHAGLFCFCHYCGRTGHQMQECSDEAAINLSKEGPKLGIWFHASRTKGRICCQKSVREKEFVWLEISKLQPMLLTKHEEAQKNEFGGPKNKHCFGFMANIVVSDRYTPKEPTEALKDGPPVSLPKKASSNLGQIHEAQFFSTVDLLDTSPAQSQNRPTSEQIHLEANLQSQNAATGFNEDIEKEVAQSNTSTAHALRAWAWSNGRPGGIGLWWRRGSFSRMSFSPRHILVVVSVDDVCSEAIRWISILPLDSGESDRDLLPHCFSESIDPSVDGCTSRQRSLKGGWAETLDATGEILCLWGKDDYLTFLVLYLYYDILCNRFIFV